MQKICLLKMLLFFFGYTQAQNTSPYWSTAGNNNTSEASKLGTTNLSPLRFLTNNTERMRINADGRVGLGITAPLNILTVKTGGGIPAASWGGGVSSPVFMGLGERVSSELVLGGASNISTSRAVIQGRRSRGTLAAPLVVQNNDYIASFLASAYDGKTFQNPATISFFVDSIASVGNVPTRISFVTGSNSANRTEKLKITSRGDFDFNNGQLYLENLFDGFNSGRLISEIPLSVTTDSWGTSINVVNNNAEGTGIRASSNFGIIGTGNTEFEGIGVVGICTECTGVEGRSNLGIGVVGKSRTTYYEYGAIGVSGTAYLGVRGIGTYGVKGESNVGNVVGGTGVYGIGRTGVRAEGKQGSGLYATGSDPGGYGIYSHSDQSIGLYSSTDNSKSYAGFFAGRVYSSGGYTSSDVKLKKDITDVRDAMDIIKKLKPKYYQYRQDGNYKYMNLPEGKHYGLMAQDIEAVLPGLVSEAEFDVSKLPHLPANSGRPPEVKSSATSDLKKPGASTSNVISGNLEINNPGNEADKAEIISFKVLNYTELIPLIVQAIQEQETDKDKKINDLQHQINELKELVINLQKGSIKTGAPTGFLRQNLPNPFRSNTVIGYNIARDVSNAHIKITDTKGNLIKALSVPAGAGEINIKKQEMAVGIYNYTLYVDNQAVDTKQMVLMR